jgi:hypothetical protein
MSDQSKTPERPLSDEQQWQLALAYLQRGETAAHVLRAALCFCAIAVVGLVLTQMKIGDPARTFAMNVASVVLALVAVFFLVKSWQLQKEKALERFKYLKAKNADAIALYDGVTSQLVGLQSRFWDWLAFWALAGAILVQLAIRMTDVATTPPAPPPPPPPTLPM